MNKILAFSLLVTMSAVLILVFTVISFAQNYELIQLFSNI